MSNLIIFRYITIICLFAFTSARLMSIEVLEVKILDSYSITKTFPGKLLPIEQSELAFEIPGKIKNIYVDVGDYASARRFLVFFLYLNSNFDGRTSFSEYDMQVYPKAGRLLMFPPTWTYLHTGHKPKLESKYIIGSYLHYV